MKKYALIGIGTWSAKAVDSFDYSNMDIDRIAVDDNSECLNSLQNSKAVKINPENENENENYKLGEEDKKKISDLINGYDKVCFFVCLSDMSSEKSSYKAADTIKEIIKTHNDKHFIFVQTPVIFQGKKLYAYSQKTINYLKNITNNIFIIDSKETIERTWAFKSEDRNMQEVNSEKWITHRTEFWKNFENRLKEREEI